MFQLWEVTGRAMVDVGFLKRLLEGDEATKVRDDKLFRNLLGLGYRLGLFERGELAIWLADDLFVDMLKDLAGAAGNVPLQKPASSEFHAAVALALFDNQFRQSVEDGNPARFKFRLTPEEIEWIQHFLKHAVVKVVFKVLKNRYWETSCEHAMAPDPNYYHRFQRSPLKSPTPGYGGG